MAGGLRPHHRRIDLRLAARIAALGERSCQSGRAQDDLAIPRQEARTSRWRPSTLMSTPACEPGLDRGKQRAAAGTTFLDGDTLVFPRGRPVTLPTAGRRQAGAQSPATDRHTAGLRRNRQLANRTVGRCRPAPTFPPATMTVRLYHWLIRQGWGSPLAKVESIRTGLGLSLNFWPVARRVRSEVGMPSTCRIL
jgi:hypothetical protein